MPPNYEQQAQDLLKSALDLTGGLCGAAIYRLIEAACIEADKQERDLLHAVKNAIAESRSSKFDEDEATWRADILTQSAAEFAAQLAEPGH